MGPSLLAFSVCALFFLAGSNLADQVDEKFAKCCNDTGVTPACGNGWCTYPPPAVVNPLDQNCIGKHINEFIQCYAQYTDNRPCCAEKGVPDGSTWWKPYPCQDLCDGSTNQHSFNLFYFSACEAYKGDISTCNHNAHNDTVGMSRRG